MADEYITIVIAQLRKKIEEFTAEDDDGEYSIMFEEIGFSLFISAIMHMSRRFLMNRSRQNLENLQTVIYEASDSGQLDYLDEQFSLHFHELFDYWRNDILQPLNVICTHFPSLKSSTR